MKSIKLVAVGDSTVGKTCLLVSYTSDPFPPDDTPTVVDEYQATTVYEGQQIILNMWDTSGDESLDRLRPLSYPDTDVVLVCFSIVSPVSFENAELKWIPEMKHHCPNVPIVLVGTKLHLRNDSEIIEQMSSKNLVPITKEQGFKLGSKIKAFKYVECSALAREGLSDVFEAAVEAVIDAQLRKEQKAKDKCTVS